MLDVGGGSETTFILCCSFFATFPGQQMDHEGSLNWGAKNMDFVGILTCEIKREFEYMSPRTTVDDNTTRNIFLVKHEQYKHA